MDCVALKSFAKVNLTLDVMAPRPDGYHDIRSVMQTIDLHDTITIRKTDSPAISVSADAPGVPSDERNLAHRAAVLISETAGLDCGIHIEIEKRIPVQAGLGGGSSNGAAVLLGMNRLFGLGLQNEQLAEMASSLGSDAPFFIHGGTALAEGRGEILTKLPDAPSMILAVVKPDVGVSTPWAYRALDAIENREPGRSTGMMLEAIGAGDYDRMLRALSNDFETVVYDEFLDISVAHDLLLFEDASKALLCGSGAAMLGVFGDQESAARAVEHMKTTGQTFISHTITRSEARDPWL